MTDIIRAKFEELHPYKEGSNKSLYESLYEIFKEGWEEGVATAPRIGYAIVTIDYDDWGCKPDGYMVGFTKEDLEKRCISYEARNTRDDGQCYERPHSYEVVVLSEEAVADLTAAKDTHNCVWYRNESFKRGEESE